MAADEISHCQSCCKVETETWPHVEVDIPSELRQAACYRYAAKIAGSCGTHTNSVTLYYSLLFSIKRIREHE